MSDGHTQTSGLRWQSTRNRTFVHRSVKLSTLAVSCRKNVMPYVIAFPYQLLHLTFAGAAFTLLALVVVGAF